MGWPSAFEWVRVAQAQFLLDDGTASVSLYLIALAFCTLHRTHHNGAQHYLFEVSTEVPQCELRTKNNSAEQPISTPPINHATKTADTIVSYLDTQHPPLHIHHTPTTQCLSATQVP
jgi:hypothetical protein